MNVLASESSSDCESGWTLYLEQSFLTPKSASKFADAAKNNSGACRGKGKHVKVEEDEEEEEEEEEEDLSMVSDASSGPPHFHEDEGYFNCHNGYFYPPTRDTTTASSKLARSNSGKRQKRKEHRRRKLDQELPSFLDDTASSPAFNFSKSNYTHANNQASMESVLEYSQGFSATHFEQGRSSYQECPFGYMQPSMPGSQLENNQWF